MNQDNLRSFSDLFPLWRFHIPDYQRGFAWEDEQLVDLIEDLDTLTKNTEHFTGLIVLHPNDDKALNVENYKMKARPVYDVIDGQQRLTSVIILLEAIRRFAEQYDHLEGMVEGIYEYFIADQDPIQQPIPFLILNQDCRDYFQNTILGFGPADIYGARIRSHERLDNALKFFLDYLYKQQDERGVEFPGWLEELYRKVTSQLKVLIYMLRSEADAGVVFESMNNRGKEITPLEIVKNQLLYISGKLDLSAPHKLAKHINKTWSAIFETMMASGMDESYEDALLRVHWYTVYDPVEENWKDGKAITERFNLRIYKGDEAHEELFHELMNYVQTLERALYAFRDLHDPSHPDAFRKYKSNQVVTDEIRTYSIKLIRLNRIAPFRPLLVATRLRYPEDPKIYLEMVKACELFAFRVYAWAERGTRGQYRLFQLGYLLNQGMDVGTVIEEINRLSLQWDFCPDQRFNARFNLDAGVDWYRWSAIQYFLYEYEQYLSKGRLQVYWEYFEGHSKKQTIEHILPQTPEDDYWLERFQDDEERQRWTHDIGNLTLTYDNSSLGNRKFPLKRGSPDTPGTYAASPLFVERMLAQYEDWAPEQITHRRQEIQVWALKRWAVETPPPLPADRTVERISRLAEVYGVGELFQQILDVARDLRLPISPKKWCLVFAPPRMPTGALFTIWPKYGYLSVGMWFERFGYWTKLEPKRVREYMSSWYGDKSRYRDVTAQEGDAFVRDLRHLLQEACPLPVVSEKRAKVQDKKIPAEERLELIADEHGSGDAFRLILQTARECGLYVRTHPSWQVAKITPMQNRNYGLFWVGPRLHFDVYDEGPQKYYDLSPEQMKELFGQRRQLTADEVDRLVKTIRETFLVSE